MKNTRVVLFLLLVPISVLSAWRSVSAGSLAESLRLVIKGNQAAAQSQVRIDKLGDETRDLLIQYRSTQQEIESLRIYNDQVSKLIEAQKQEIAALEGQIQSATSIGREITPVMLRMINTLQAFVELDVPFLLEERQKRVADLRAMMDRADVTDSEKYRRLLEAYQIENEFGRNIEAYESSLNIGGKERTVNFLRIGRIALMYQTLDGKEVGFWDKQQKKWRELSGEYHSSTQRGIRIARKITAPDLIRIPVLAAEEAP